MLEVIAVLTSKVFRVFQNPKVLIGLFVAVLAVYTLHTVKRVAYEAGYAAATQEFTQQALKDAAEREKERVRLEGEIAVLTEKAKQKSTVINETVNKDLEKQNDKTEAIIADLRNDNKRLSINVKRLSAAKATAELAAGVATDHATSRVELSRESSEFLVRLAGRADETAVRLKGCQAHIRLLEETVSEYNAKK